MSAFSSALDRGFGNQAIRTRRQAVTEAEFDIEHAKLEIGHAEDLLPLLLHRQKVADLAEIGVIFDAEEAVLAEIAREPCRGEKIGFAERAKSDIDAIGLTMNSQSLLRTPRIGRISKRIARLRECRRLVAEFKVDSIKKFLLGRMRHNKQIADFGAVGQERAAAADRKRRIEADFPPIGDPISELRRAVKRMVWNEPAGKVRFFAAADRIIEMLLNGPLPNRGNKSGSRRQRAPRSRSPATGHAHRYSLHGEVSDLKMLESAVPMLWTSPGCSAGMSACPVPTFTIRCSGRPSRFHQPPPSA